MSGIALSKTICTLHLDTVIFWMIAYGCHHFAQDISRLGICCCLEKPFRIDKIRRSVREAFEMIHDVTRPSLLHCERTVQEALGPHISL
jgi:DNA-binding NtrC family response regulator